MHIDRARVKERNMIPREVESMLFALGYKTRFPKRNKSASLSLSSFVSLSSSDQKKLTARSRTLLGKLAPKAAQKQLKIIVENKFETLVIVGWYWEERG